ncbi:hypothetical protein BaRGS_00002560, partial [Batillaria attramentaria]
SFQKDTGKISGLVDYDKVKSGETRYRCQCGIPCCTGTSLDLLVCVCHQPTTPELPPHHTQRTQSYSAAHSINTKQRALAARSTHGAVTSPGVRGHIAASHWSLTFFGAGWPVVVLKRGGLGQPAAY